VEGIYPKHSLQLQDHQSVAGSNLREFHKAETRIRILSIKIGNQEQIDEQDAVSTDSYELQISRFAKQLDLKSQSKMRY
jgi:hypothetical protein